MPRLPSLLKKLESLHRQHVQIEQEIARAEREIVAAGKSPPKRRPKRRPHTEAVELVKPLVKVLRDADGPLLRREIAARLGIAPAAVGYRIRKAIEAKFVERVGGRYRAAKVVPTF